MIEIMFTALVSYTLARFIHAPKPKQIHSRREPEVGDLANAEPFWPPNSLSVADDDDGQSDAFDDDGDHSPGNPFDWNPATGLPMFGAQDSAGNAWGCCDSLFIQDDWLKTDPFGDTTFGPDFETPTSDTDWP